MTIRTIKSPLKKEEIKQRKKESLKNKRIAMKQYTLYSLLLAILKKNLNLTDDLKALLEDIQNGLEKMTKFMIEDRFNTPQKKKSVRKKVKTILNPDSVEFFGEGPKPKQKKATLQMLDIIKFFKTLENFTLKRGDLLYNVEELSLGQFAITASEVIANLQTLLLSSLTLDESNRKLLLDYLFSIITIYRHFKVKALPDTSTISGEYEGDPLDQIETTWFSQELISAWLKLFLSKWKIEMPKLTIYSGNASSPNSGASSSKIIEDIIAIRNDKKLTDAIAGLSKHFDGDRDFSTLRNTLLATVTKSVFRYPPAIKVVGKPEIENAVKTITSKGANADIKHSRLFHFTANGGKARIIANVDWVTQTALSGIHFMLFSMLKSVSSDFTFDHKAGISHVMECADFKNKNKEYTFYSIDLSAATDRMPRLLQATLIEGICTFVGLNGSDIKNHWLNIVDRVYDTKNSPINNGQPIRYAVGQGMGLFTSWAIMALMHHYIINGLCKVDMDRYCLVGDDLLFFGSKKEYSKYISIMSAIGLKVNPMKTIVSSSNDRPTIEFARNFVIDGIRINPAPFGVLFAWNDDKVSFETLMWHLSYCLTPTLLKEVIVTFNPKISRLQMVWLLAYIHTYTSINVIKERNLFSDLLILPLWFTDEAVKRIFTITKSPVSIRQEIEKQHGFMATFVSQCTVRNTEELLITRELASAIKYLSQATDNMATISSYIFDRLSNSDIIKYDADIKGGPLLSKRERKLLKDLFENYA